LENNSCENLKEKEKCMKNLVRWMDGGKVSLENNSFSILKCFKVVKIKSFGNYLK